MSLFTSKTILYNGIYVYKSPKNKSWFLFLVSLYLSVRERKCHYLPPRLFAACDPSSPTLETETSEAVESAPSTEGKYKYFAHSFEMHKANMIVLKDSQWHTTWQIIDCRTPSTAGCLKFINCLIMPQGEYQISWQRYRNAEKCGYVDGVCLCLQRLWWMYLLDMDLVGELLSERWRRRRD